VRLVWVLLGLATVGLAGGTRAALWSTPTTTIGGTRVTVGPCADRVPGRSTSIGGRRYAREGVDTFAKSGPLGSFASSNPDRIVYMGDHGMAWTEYPDDWPSTYSGSAEGYQPSTVLSVHNGVLDFYLHNDSRGHPVGADPSPLPGGHRYQTYGVWSFCERVAPARSRDLADFYQAPLLWPENQRDWQWAESDFPEANLDTLDFSGYSHHGGSGAQEVFDILPVEPSFDPSRWHLYTQTWGPGFRSYYVDGQLVGTSSNQVWYRPERWQLQIEPSGFNDGGSGHVYVKWVWIGTVRTRASRAH
jgi:hypothetical protein